MRNYVEIIDENVCQPSTNLIINGIPAKSSEWEKYRFYPKKGVVGIIVGEGQMHFGIVYIIEINEKIYVPIEPSGVKVITENEYFSKYSNNLTIGRDFENRSKNGQIDQAMKDINKMFGW